MYRILGLNEKKRGNEIGLSNSMQGPWYIAGEKKEV